MNERKENDKVLLKSTGSKMWWIFWLITLVLLTAFFSRIEEAFYNPNSRPDASEEGNARQVTLERNRYNHYVATGTINNKEAIFFLDTGASQVVIPSAIAQDLGLERGPQHQVSTANGTINVYSTTIKRLTIGNIVLTDVKASINPHMDDIDILLGMSALKSLDFNQQNNRLTLKQYY